MSDKQQINVTIPPPPQRQIPDQRDELLELQLRRERLQIAQLEAEAAKTAEADAVKLAAKESELAFRRSLVAQLEVGKKQRRHAQANCPHLQENGKTAVGGQRDSHHVNRWLCLACLKEWVGNESVDNPGGLPMRLRPANEKVGGPEF
jgi:hypothetical protein